MEQYWKELPTDVIHLILKYTGKVVYRDNQYVDINKLKGKYNEISSVCTRHVENRKRLYFSEDLSNWYYEFSFDRLIGNPRHYHGLSYSYYPSVFEICYFCFRDPEPDEGGTAWVQIRTKYNLESVPSKY